MKTVTLTEDWGGKKAGATIAVDDRRADMLIEKGLAEAGAMSARQIGGRSRAIKDRITK